VCHSVSTGVCYYGVVTSEDAVYRYYGMHGLEAGRIGGYIQMYSVQSLIGPDCEKAVCINSLECLVCILFYMVRSVAMIFL
jgi:hypothetical protein